MARTASLSGSARISGSGSASVSGSATAAPTAAAIVEAARQLFATKGYEGASVVEITRLAGTSVGSLYYHFGDKLGVFHAMYREHSERLDERVRSVMKVLKSAGVTDPRTLYLANARTFLMGLWEERDVALLLARGHVPPGFTTLRSSEDWDRRNAVLLTDSESPATLAAVASAMTGAFTSWSRMLGQCATREEAEQFVNAALVVIGRIVRAEPEAESQSLRSPGPTRRKRVPRSR